MHTHCGLKLAVLLLSALSALATEKVSNDKVRAVQQILPPRSAMALPKTQPGVLVYMDDGTVTITPAHGMAHTKTVRRGDTVFLTPTGGSLRNTGAAELRMARVDYLGAGTAETWGTAGLAPNYKLLFENRWGRVYDIKIAAGTSEPQHTHHDRVVVCLSGAELEHILPDGRKESSSLKTDEVVWRHGATHVGHNMGKTDLWVIAIEPK